MLQYDNALLPEHMQAPMQRYMEQGIHPGDFLIAVLNNDLREAVYRADHVNRAALADIVQWLYNEAPGHSWGDLETIERYVKGLNPATPKG